MSKIISFLSFLILLSTSVYAEQDTLCSRVADELHEGDLIFLDIDNILFEQVAVATKTWTSHVGVAIYNEGWFVVESAVLFSRETPLCKYLARTQDERVEVRRLKEFLSSRHLEDLKSELSSQMGIMYDIGFDYDSQGLFCSKLVFNTYKNVLGIEVGEIKTFRMILGENSQSDLTIWQVWFLGNIPWDRRTVTPRDQLIDDDFFTVFQNGDLRSTFSTAEKRSGKIP